jgi:predicted phage terminase large subunit-like protein
VAEPLSYLYLAKCRGLSSKANRIVAQSAKIEAGHVHLTPEWLDNFLLELLTFPHGRHDDQVDRVSQFLRWVALQKSLELTSDH